MRVHLADALFPSRRGKTFAVICSEIRNIRSDRLFQRVSPFFFSFSSLSFQIYTSRETEKERERERERECKNERAYHAPIKHSTLFFIPSSTLSRPLIPSFPFAFLFFKLSLSLSLSLSFSPFSRGLSFYTLCVYLFARSSISPFVFFLHFIPLSPGILSIPLFVPTSESSRFLFPHSSIIFLPSYAHPYPLAARFSLHPVVRSFASPCLCLSHAVQRPLRGVIA